MRAGEVIGTPVCDADGRRIGAIREIRTKAVRLSGRTGLVVRGVIVGRTRVRMFGYQRYGEQGPAPLRAIVRWLHRHTRYVDWADLDLGTSPATVRKRFDQLDHPRDTTG